MAFHTIVVGVDGGPGGRDALALAQRMRSVAGELVEVRADGAPARALHLAAARHQAALIVVGSSRRGAVGRVLAGDDALATLHGSPCPVLIAPAGYAEHDAPIASVGVGFDGTAGSRAAVVLARDVAVALGARLKVLTVLEPPAAWTAYPRWAHDASARERGARAATRATLDRFVAALGADASGELLDGRPARELARAAQELDLLVCGSRSEGPLARLLLGSTSECLAREAPCPVMVLPGGIPEHVLRDDPTWIAAHGY